MNILPHITPAVFFTLDGVVRRLTRHAREAYHSEFGQVPPAPVHVGEQELILPVVDWIRTRCAQTGALPIGLDQAPYIEGGVMTDDAYREVLAETIVLLREAGLTEVKMLYCPHKAKENEIYDAQGNVIDRTFTPLCRCRFPNEGLVINACKAHNVSYYRDMGRLRVLKPSVLVGNDNDARNAAIESLSMDFVWVESILNGSIHYRSMVTNAHLKAAALIKDHQKHGGIKTLDAEHVTIRTESLPDMPALPPELDRPAGT